MRWAARGWSKTRDGYGEKRAHLVLGDGVCVGAEAAGRVEVVGDGADEDVLLFSRVSNTALAAAAHDEPSQRRTTY
jgi:hypothetical protein